MKEIPSGLPKSYARAYIVNYAEEEPEWHWEQQNTTPFAMLTAGWAPQVQGSHMNGNYSVDFKFEQEHPSYFAHQPVHSPNIGYPVSDLDTPSTASYQDPMDQYSTIQTSHLHPHHVSAPMYTQSPHSSVSATSPYQTSLASPPVPQVEFRPPLESHHSAPEPRNIKPASTSTSASNKHRGANEVSDDDYDPNNTSGRRKRQRQRIPHTAVERRYRENLNAHLEKLRQAVPTLASRKGSGGKMDGHEGVKPSKCEVLHGAIEHIMAQDRQIALKDKHIMELRAENQALRASLEQLQDWIRANSR